MKSSDYRKFYLISLAVLLAFSAYPLYMGAKVLWMFLRLGYIEPSEYPRYVIPYAPMCVGIVASAALMPLFFRYTKHALLASSSAGMALFAICELLTERIPVGNLVFPNGRVAYVETWQMALCRSLTPEEIAGQTRVIGDIVFAESNPAFKFHFYLIAVILLLAVIALVHAYSRMILTKDFGKKRPLAVQLICTVLLIALCILACFTAFYRTGDIQVPPVSALLMCTFFVILGVTFGSYIGTLFYKKNRGLPLWLPAASAMLATLAMYVGELMLMGGELFVLGEGLLFRPMAGTPFALMDVLVILLSGGITWGLMRWLNQAKVQDT